MDKLTFLQTSSDIKLNVLLNLKNYYEQESALHKRGINARINKIAQKGISDFQENFDKKLSKETCLKEGIPESLYSLERDSGRVYFHADKRVDFFKSFFE